MIHAYRYQIHAYRCTDDARGAKVTIAKPLNDGFTMAWAATVDRVRDTTTKTIKTGLSQLRTL
jgi:hypothetical protein